MNIEEALIILRFDGAAATNGIRNTRTALNDLTRGASDYGRQLGSSLSNVAKVTAELSVMGRGIATAFNTAMFIPNLVNGTAEATRNMGQFAANVGMSADRIKALQQFMGQLGGSDAGTNAFIADIAKRKAALESGFVSPYDVMPKQFHAGGGDYNKVLGGTAEDAIKEYAKVYDFYKNQKKNMGKSDVESEAYASQQMLEMGIQEDMLQVLKLGNEELQKRIDLESKRAPLLTETDLENAKSLRENWTHIEQSIDNATTVTMRNLTNLSAGGVKETAGYVDKLLVNSSKSWQRMLDPMARIREIMNNPKSVFLQDLKEIGEILPFFEKMFNWLTKISGVSLENIKNPIKTAYDANTTTAEKQHDQNVVGNIAAFLGDKDAIEAKTTIDNYDFDQKNLKSGVLASFKHAGFSNNQAKALAAEVGRENDYNPANVFGSHTDAANGATNTGFFSWQKERAEALKNRLAEKGLLQDGKIKHSQESLDEMAAFAKTELESGKYKGSTRFMSNPNIGSEDAADVLGHGYIKWAMGQNVLKSGEAFDWKKHDAKRAGYYNQMDALMSAGGGSSGSGGGGGGMVDTKDLVQQPTPAQGATITNNVEINVKSTDPQGAASETKTAMENLNKSAPYQSGMH